jgi:hypothetical protein
VHRIDSVFSKEEESAGWEAADQSCMNATVKKYTPALALALLMYGMLCAIYPYYQYYIDPDGTAYLTISKRYAAGDFLKAVNGYWSPWSCWLTAALIKVGVAAIPASVIINALGATGFLVASHSLFLKFNISKQLQWLLAVVLAVFLCFAIFWQSFDDLWECFFLLVALRIMLAERFTLRPVLWVILGAVGALAYFAKAYAFPFFILNTVCCVYLLTANNKMLWLKICAVSIMVMLICSFPWIYALHAKYGIWTTGTAGSLNMSWYLVGHPYWKDVDVFIPPVYHDSPYYWEDPYVANGPAPHFWSSLHLAGLQLLRIGYNGLKLLISMVQLSLLFPLIALLAVWILRSKQLRALFQGNIRLIALPFVLFPLGYALVNFESRYLWYMVPLGMVIGAQAFQMPAFSFGMPQRLLTWLFPISFLAFPIAKLIEMFDSGKQDYELAKALKDGGVNGAFSGNAHARHMSKLAYFSGNPYYYVARTDTISNADMLKELRRYRIRYFIDFSNAKGFAKPPFKHQPLVDENGKTFPAVPIKGAENVQIFLVSP